jgi:tetratricopeptide (TPR) repeat protein
MCARSFIILAMVVVVPKIQAGAVLRGVVLANGKGGPPMENVVVSAIAANDNNTGADGKFKFTFPNMNPGERVTLTVSKKGYVVINELELAVTLPAHPDEMPAIFFMCKEGDREEMTGRFYRVKGVEVIDEGDREEITRRFYRLKSFDAIDETYKKKLEEAQNASAGELTKLRQERDQAKETAEKAAEMIAKQKPDGVSELYQTAMRLFLDGKVDQAIDTLSDEKLRELSKAAKERKSEAWLLKAELLTVQYRLDDAEKAYQGAIDTSPESFKANFAFARFNQQLNRNDKAMTAYRQCLELARRNNDNGEIAATLNNLGDLDRAQNRMEAAREEYQEALMIRRELAQKNRDTYLPNVAMTLNNLANLDRDQNRMEAARKGYQEALMIYRELAQKSLDTYLPNVAATLNNLANLDRDQNRLEAARKGYEEAVTIYRELAQKNPDTYLPNVAATLNNLANLDGDQNRSEAARKGYEEALKIRRELAQKNPDTYLPDVALTLNNLANLDSDENRMEAARKEYEEALKIRRELAQKNPDTYLPNVAATLNNLAILDRAQNRIEAARKGYEEALVIFERFAARDTEQFQSDVARVKHQLQTLSK